MVSIKKDSNFSLALEFDLDWPVPTWDLTQDFIAMS